MEFRASQQMQGNEGDNRDKENGVLLSQNITANELTKKITDFCKLDSYQYKKNRNDARYFWNKKFNADYNYQKFINEISN